MLATVISIDIIANDKLISNLEPIKSVPVIPGADNTCPLSFADKIAVTGYKKVRHSSVSAGAL